MRFFFIAIWLFFYSAAQGSESIEPTRKTICLNMIVKNESKVIERCLASVKGLIDYWVIVDTGSNDGTQQIIRDFMGDVPGELYERPWVNFGHNRTEALNLAKKKADYLLFIDADEVLEVTEPLDKSCLDKDGYLIDVRMSDDPVIKLRRGFLINTRLDWSWKNVLHEKLVTSEPVETVHLDFLPRISISALSKDGNRSNDPQKYLKDALLLEKALQDEPTNADYVYYLAQSYLNAEKYDLAIKNYEKRAEMGGWDQAVFWSKYYAGVLRETTGQPSETFISNYSKAFEIRPTRAEPLYRLANYFYNSGNYTLAYSLSKTALTIPVPDDFIYIEYWIYDYGIPFIFGNAAFSIGHFEEAKGTYERILLRTDLPREFREKVTQNLSLVNLSLEKKMNVLLKASSDQ